MFKYIDNKKYENLILNFRKAIPFNFCIVDNFFDLETAYKLESEFLDFNNDDWYIYKNELEDKKANNSWNIFPQLTTNVFVELMSQKFVDILSSFVGEKLYTDPSLHGGGWHIHGTGGNLNPHLDYSIHPKLELERKLNLIIYLSNELEETHGGHLGFWSHDKINNCPLELIKEISPKFNRAVLFDTTQNSWHGMSRPLVQPKNIFRKSLAIYYLKNPDDNVNVRRKALYAPRDDQKNSDHIKQLILLRSNSIDFHKAYRNNDNDKDN